MTLVDFFPLMVGLAVIAWALFLTYLTEHSYRRSQRKRDQLEPWLPFHRTRRWGHRRRAVPHEDATEGR